jgi:hypothetical protein
MKKRKVLVGYLMGFTMGMFVSLLSYIIDIVWLYLLIIGVTGLIMGALIAEMENK